MPGAGEEQIQGVGLSPLERALSHLLTIAPHLTPDRLAENVREVAALLGGRDTVLLLVDLAQHELLPVGDEAGTRAQPVEGSAAGAAFRDEATVTEPVDGGIRRWIPILDSAERVGVLGTTTDVTDASDATDATDDRAIEARWVLLAGLLGELVVTKSRYGDALSTARRTKPVTLTAELRWSLLPPLTFSSPDVLVSGILEPAYDIAGDAFDYSVGEPIVHVGLFDAMGHGLEASLMANLAIGSYRNSRREGADLATTVRSADRVIQLQFGDSRFVTGQLATLDHHSGVLEAVNAGHPWPMVFHSDGTRTELACARCLPLGLGSEPGERVTTQLRPGDVILFHTDGVSEARSASGAFFGTERLYDLVGALLAARTRPPEILRIVLSVVIEHEPELRDDATLLLLGWRLGHEALPPATRILSPDQRARERGDPAPDATMAAPPQGAPPPAAARHRQRTGTPFQK